MASGNITRIDRCFENFNLANSQERIRIPTPIARALRIVASVMSGSWTNSTVTIKIGAGWTSRDFASAKSMAPGTPSKDVLITEDEMKGVDEICIERSGSVDAGTLLMVHVKEQDETLG